MLCSSEEMQFLANQGYDRRIAYPEGSRSPKLYKRTTGTLLSRTCSGGCGQHSLLTASWSLESSYRVTNNFASLIMFFGSGTGKQILNG